MDTTPSLDSYCNISGEGSVAMECKFEGEIVRLQEQVHNLTGWQKSQNGSIKRVEEKVDSINNKILWGFIAVIVMQIISNYMG